MMDIGRIIFGPNPINKRDPRLLLWRVRHYLFGPYMGCSCNKCFTDPRRIVHGGEAIRTNQRLANHDNEIRDLRARLVALERDND